MNKQTLKYHLFLFLSTFARGLIEVFSLVLLYKKGFSINNIFIFLLSTYLIGLIATYISIKLNKKITLITSNILYGISFLYLSKISNHYLSLLFLAFFLSLSNYSYHTIRHYYAFHMLKESKKTNHIITTIYIGTMFSSLIGSLLLENISPFFTSVIVLVLSLLSCIPIFTYQNINNENNNTVEKKSTIDKKKYIIIKKVKLEKNKFIFSILEQFKVLFLELQPLFLYLYINNSYLYIGIFNIIMNISSLIVVIFLTKYISPKKFKYITISLGIVLLLKLNLKNNIFLFIIALLEGILLKLYETFSLKNLYQLGNNHIKDYLIVEEYIFLISKSIIIVLCILFSYNLKIILHIFIIGIILSGFFIE